MQLIRPFTTMLGRCVPLIVVVLTGCARTSVDKLPNQAQPPPIQAPASPAQGTSRIYVANESSNSVTVIDGVSFTVLSTVEARNHATHDLALARDGKHLFATNLASGKLSVIDTDALETIASIPTGSRCHVVTLTNDNRQAWVANIGEDNISIVDTASYRILGTTPVGKGPTGIAFSVDGRFAYVSNQGDKNVAVVDTASHLVIKTIPVKANPHFLVLGPDRRIWGTNTGENDIYVIDPMVQDIIATLEVGPNPQQIAFAYKGMAGPYAYVTVGGSHQIVIMNIDPKRLRILEQIDVTPFSGRRPNGIWANPEGTCLFVAHEGSNNLLVIDTGTNEVIATVPVGRKPIRVVVSR
jgi:YVTN family beta-propeller protein